MNIILVTLSYPYNVAAEQSFIENELLGFEKWREGLAEIRLTITPGLSDNHSTATLSESIEMDHALIRARANKKIKRKALYLIQIMFSLPHLVIKRKKNKSVQFFVDFRRLLKWCDEYSTAKSAIRSGWLGDLSREDVVYTWWLSGYTYAIAKSLARKKDRPRIITRAHGGDLFAIRGVQIRQAKTISLCDKVFPSTIRGKVELDARCQSADKILVGRLGVSVCHDPVLNTAEFKQKYSFGSGSDSLQLITISGIDPVKDLAKFSQYLNSISDLFYPITWHHFGEPVNRLAEEANQNQLGKNFKIRSFGNIKNSEIHEILRNYSQDGKTIMVNFSISEGTALSLVEAVANGVPVIGRNVGGVNEIVSDHTGRLISENPTIHELHQAIVDVLARRTELVKSCKEYWSKNYDAYRVYSNFYSDIHELANN
jgi:glycosyltransferase involved in cell wall biosynthesis